MKPACSAKGGFDRQATACVPIAIGASAGRRITNPDKMYGTGQYEFTNEKCPNGVVIENGVWAVTKII